MTDTNASVTMVMVYAPKQPGQLVANRSEIEMRSSLPGDDITFGALKQQLIVPIELSDKPFYPISGDRVSNLFAYGDANS